MMKKTQYILTLCAVLLCKFGLHAQTTKEQATEIIFQYIVDEDMRTDVLLLSTIDILPDADGISTIVTHNSGQYETFSVEYPCWVYHINEWMDVNCCQPHRYLFVNKVTGNVLEVKTKGSPHEPSPESWQLVYSANSGLYDTDTESKVSYFPNPVDDFLEITCEEDFEYITICDIQGKKVFQETAKKYESVQTFDVSSLHKGLYIVNVFSETRNILSFKILKM